MAPQLSLPRRASSLQLRGGLHWRAAGTLRYVGADAVERASFVGAERGVVAALGASVVTPRWLRVDLAVVFASDRSHVLGGLAGRF